MFYHLARIFRLVGQPVSLLVLLACIGVALTFTRRGRTGRSLAAAALIGLIVILFTPLGAALLRPLENRFPPPPADLPAPTGIIVLGGALEEQQTEARGQPYLTEDGMRLIAGLELARRYPAARLVFSGGGGSVADHTSPEAVGVRKFWQDLGGPDDRMSFESNSRNTWENGVLTRDLVKPKRGDSWILVTSAWHMPRSVGIFRRLGFKVIPYPVAYRTFGDARDWTSLITPAQRLSMLDLGYREWIGLLVYRLAGKTNALFPAP